MNTLNERTGKALDRLAVLVSSLALTDLAVVLFALWLAHDVAEWGGVTDLGFYVSRHLEIACRSVRC